MHRTWRKNGPNRECGGVEEKKMNPEGWINPDNRVTWTGHCFPKKSTSKVPQMIC